MTIRLNPRQISKKICNGTGVSDRAPASTFALQLQRESAGKEERGPISKKRNKHLQSKLIEADKLAPHWNPQLAALREKKLKKGNRNRATLAVARKLVEYLLARLHAVMVFRGRRVGPNSIFRDGMIIPKTANGCLVA